MFDTFAQMNIGYVFYIGGNDSMDTVSKLSLIHIYIADVVISSDVLHHDMDATGFGYPLGQIPRMDTLSFAADERLIKLCLLYTSLGKR